MMIVMCVPLSKSLLGRLARGPYLPGTESSRARPGGTRPELGYPTSDPAHAKVGPKPSTFSGQRALDFVLQNQELIDKTLFFNALRAVATDDNLPCKA